MSGYRAAIDIEQVVLDYLSEHFDDVYLDVPDDRPETFITIERTGGGMSSATIDRPMVAIQCWAGRRSEASKRVHEVDKLMQELPDHHRRVSMVTRNALYNYPDPDSHSPRYQAVFDITTY